MMALASACDTSEPMTPAASEVGQTEGHYIAPGEWRQAFTRQDIVDFSEDYGRGGTALTKRSGTEHHDGFAVELMEAAVNYDNRLTTTDLPAEESAAFAVDVPAAGTWNDTEVADLYAAVNAEIGANVAEGRAVSSVNLTGPLDGPDGRYLEADLTTHEIGGSGVPSLGEQPFYGWNDSPWAGCGNGSLNATARLESIFGPYRQANIASELRGPRSTYFTYDIVRTFTSFFSPSGTGPDGPILDESDRLQFRTGDFPTGSTDPDVRGEYKNYFASGQGNNCISRSAVDNYGRDHYEMGVDQGVIIYGDAPGYQYEYTADDGAGLVSIDYSDYNVTRRGHAPSMRFSGAFREWQTRLSVGKLIIF